MDEPLYQPLLAFRFDAEQLASFHSAGPTGILEGQPASAVVDVGHLVARTLCPTPTDLLTCRQESASEIKENHNTSDKRFLMVFVPEWVQNCSSTTKTPRWELARAVSHVDRGLGSNQPPLYHPKSSLYHLSYCHLSKRKGSRLGSSSVCLPFELMMFFPPLLHYQYHCTHLVPLIYQHYLITFDLICILYYFVIRSSPEN